MLYRIMYYNESYLLGWIMGFGAIVPCGHNVGCCRRSAGGKQQSTGLLHLDGSNPLSVHKKNPIRLDGGSFYGVDNGIRTHDLQSHNLTR